MSTNHKKRTPAALLGIVFLLASLAGVWGVKLVSPTADGLGFNNTTKVHRGDTFRAYAKWNETVNSSVIALNRTSSDTNVLSNYTETSFVWNSTPMKYNWTNYTISTNKTWSLGKHWVKIYVNLTNQSGAVSNMTQANFTLFGQLNTTFTNPAPDSIQHTGDTVTFNSTVRIADNGTAVSGINVSFYNSTGGYINSNVSDSSGIAYITHPIPSDQRGYYNFTANVTNTTTYTDPSLNDTLSIYQYGWSRVNKSTSNQPRKTSENATVEVKIADNLTAGGIQNYPVEFYLNDTGDLTLNATKQTNSSGWANYTFNITTEGVYNVTFNITDNSTLYYNASSDYQGSLLVVVDNPSVYSPNRNFSATPAYVPFNWTAGNITLKSYVDTAKLNINNKSTGIEPDYYQKNQYDAAIYDVDKCFTNGLLFTVKNKTKDSTNYTSNLGISESEWFELSPLYSCPPGKYSGNFTVKQVSNSNENIKVNSTVHIPINSENTLNTTSRDAYFKTKFDANATDYQSFYFNTSAIENTTGATFTLSGFSADFDIFVFDENENLVGKSINKGSPDEKIRFTDFPSSPEMWEIKVYGNNTTSSEDLQGNIYFTTLNSTNSSLGFGDINVTNKSTKTTTLKNEYNDVIPNVHQSKEVYKVETWSGKNTSSDYRFLVPHFAQKVKVSINWTEESGENVTDWDLFLSDPNNNIVGNSTDKYMNANVTDAPREEFVIYDDSFGQSKEGYWNISVRNQTTPPLNNYSVEAKIWYGSSWISTNFTGGFDFNRTNETVNSTYPLEVNITVESDSLDGHYEGSLIYDSPGGNWNYEIPISFNVNSSSLVVENNIGTLTKAFKTDNIGFDRTNNAQTLNLRINNTGSYNLTWVNTTSFNGTMRKDSNSNISMNIDWPTEPIMPGSSALLNVTAPIDTTLTHNDPGLYQGWIFLNTTNQTNPSYPYNTFNISLEFNLTDQLNLTIYNVETRDGDHWKEPGSTENVTYKLKVYLMNGTEITDDESGTIQSLGISNFTSAWMNETNVSSESAVMTSSIVQETSGSTNLCYGAPTYCQINTTAPSGLAGGRYRMSIKVEWNGSETKSLLTGTGSWKKLFVNASGLEFTITSDSTLNLDETNSGKANITVTNYGPLTSTKDIILDGCSDYIKNIASNGNCSGSYSGRTAGGPTINANGSSCKMWWTFDTKNVSQDRSCSLSFNTTAPRFNDPSISLDISDTAAADQQDGAAGAANCTYGSWTNDTCGGGNCSALEMRQTRSVSPSGCAIAQQCIDAPGTCGSYGLSVSVETEVINVTQGENGTNNVSAENTGDFNLSDLKLWLEGDIPPTWYSVSPPSLDLDTTESKSYTVTFSLTNISPVDVYPLNYTVNSSTVSSRAEGELRVLPAEVEKVKINETYQEMKSNFTDLERRFKDLVEAGANVSAVNQTMQDLNKTIQEAEDAIAEGNYLTAKHKLDEAKSLYSDASEEIKELEGEGLGPILWIGVGVVAIIIISILVYMLLPPRKGYHPEKGYEYKEPGERKTIGGLKSRIKELAEGVKEKLGFGREHAYDYRGRRKWRPEEEE